MRAGGLLLAPAGKPADSAFISADAATIGTSDTTIPADNSTTGTAQVFVPDVGTQPAVGATVEVVAQANVTCSAPAVTNANGITTFTFKASVAAAYTIQIKVDGRLAKATLAFTASAGTASATHSTITADQTTVAVGDSVVLTVHVKTAADAPLTQGGLSITPDISTGAGVATFSAPASLTWNGDDTYSGTLTATGAGTAATLSAKLASTSITGNTAPTCDATAGGGGFTTPDILNNADFESDFSGFTNWSYSTPTGVSRSTTQAFHGTTSVKRVIPNTTGLPDQSAQFIYPFHHLGFANQDRLWYRHYFYFDAAPNGINKYGQFFDSGLGTQFGGFGIQSGFIQFDFNQEDPGHSIHLLSIASYLNGWHSLEIDYWRNGDTGGNVLTTGTGEPSAAFWLDGVQITAALNSLPSGWYWKNNRIYPGKRTSSAQMGNVQPIGLTNGSGSETVVVNLYQDYHAISTLGRIGP